MEIEFNPGRVGKPESGQMPPVSSAPRAARVEAPFSDTNAVEASLRNGPSTRPEMVQRAASLISNVKYPPDEVLNGIATLLALHLH